MFMQNSAIIANMRPNNIRYLVKFGISTVRDILTKKQRKLQITDRGHLLKTLLPRALCMSEDMETTETEEMYELKSKDKHTEDCTMHKIFVIPGNPGLAGYYKEFVTVLYLSLLTKGLSGPTVCALSHRGHWKKREGTWYNLEEQIEYKIQQLLKMTSSSDRIILIGHSIGCYISLRIMDDPRMRDRKIDQAFLLHPTIERMARTPEGLRVGAFFGCFFQYVVFVLMFLFTLLPATFRRRLIETTLSRGKKPFPLDPCIIEATQDLLTPGALPQVLHMANHELAEVQELDVPLLRRCLPRTVMCYGVRDKWCPIEFYWEMCDRFVGTRGSRLLLLDAKIPHAFVLGHGETMAQHSSDLIGQVWLKNDK